MLICPERRGLFLTRSPSFRKKLVRLSNRFWCAKYNAQFSVIVGVVIISLGKWFPVDEDFDEGTPSDFECS